MGVGRDLYRTVEEAEAAANADLPQETSAAGVSYAEEIDHEGAYQRGECPPVNNSNKLGVATCTP